MENENLEQQEAQKNLENEESNSQDDQAELSPEQIQELKKRADVSSQNYERAKKLEEEVKKLKASGSSQEKEQVKALEQSNNDLPTSDLLYLAKSDINEEDIDEVRDWAKFKGVSIKEAHEQLKPTLLVKEEQRRTAQATQTRGGARGSSKITGEDLLSKAEKTGEIPTDDAGMKKLAEARLNRLRNNN
jgi:hypothetical protein